MQRTVDGDLAATAQSLLQWAKFTASPPHPGVVGCLAKLAKGKELDAVGRQFEPIPPLRFHDGGALVVWPGMLFPNSRGF